jgi:8-oxo-dGTP pyrophosphatase MutT (NUDIX family)
LSLSVLTTFERQLEALRRRLRDEPLPGPRTQVTMAPSERPLPDPHGESLRASRHAAALALIYLHGDEPHVALTRRRSDLKDHGGQISLPGGRIEPREGHVAAALREAEEELAIVASEVELLGELTPLWIPPSDFVVRPVVAAAHARPRFRPQPSEVEALIEAPVAMLLDPTRRREETWTRRGRPRRIPFYDIEGQQVWGATAMILAELLAVWCAASDEVNGG